MRERQYTILLHPDLEEGGYTVTVPALPGVVTEGDTLEEAVAMARDAIRLHVETLEQTGRPVPEESAPPQVLTVRVRMESGSTGSMAQAHT